MAATISLIMTVYNRSRYLGAAIESVLVQTRKDFELLVWDDGSEDNSLAIARSYADRDARVRVVAASHQGRSPSLKAAHAQCQGMYVGWVDSDDLLVPTALEETAAVLDSDSTVGLVYTDYFIMDDFGNLKSYGQRCRIPYSKNRLLIDFMTFHFRLMRRDAYESAGEIDVSMELAEDYDLCLRLSEVTQVKHINKPLYYYRIHSSNLTNRQNDLIQWSSEAVRRAIARRGLPEDYALDVQLLSRVSSPRKNHPFG